MVTVGDTWEGYEVLSEIERGAVDTFLARPLGDTTGLVCLHIREGARIQPDLFAAEIERLQRVAAEIPEIVPVLHGGVAGSVAWAVSPVQGGAVRLVDAMRGVDLGPAVLKTLIDLGSCLARAHALSAIHGLLGPDRVLVVGEGRTAITHFGFVRLFDLGADDVIREPSYAAPELLSGGRLGPRADIYGFGTLLYELLLQRELSVEEEILPLVPATAAAARDAAAIPTVLQWTIRQALAETPKRRQPSLENILAVLTPFAREWEELGGPPELPHDNPFLDVSASRRQPRETAMDLEPDDEAPLASGERAGGTGAPPPSLPSVPPDTLRTGTLPQNDVGTPHTPRATPRLPVAVEVPELDPLPPPPPVVSLGARSGQRRRLRRSLLSYALALASLLAAAWLFVLWQGAPRPVDPRPRVVHVATAPSSAAPPAPVPSGTAEARSPPEPPIGAPPERPDERRRAISTARPVDGSLMSRREPLGRSRFYLHNGNTTY
ncbi:protein kinase domain-containing protein [Sorangium sp. So ce513]|uniref:protein kinase domain-containing protein n=1 Tax=Sorangium sp. So ce513 TaxID=3133315 RepID=UPI003F5E4F8B